MTDSTIPLAQVAETAFRKIMARLDSHDKRFVDLQKVDSDKDLEITDLKSQVDALTAELAKHTDTTGLQALADSMSQAADAPDPQANPSPAADPITTQEVAKDPAPFQVVSVPTGEPRATPPTSTTPRATRPPSTTSRAQSRPSTRLVPPSSQTPPWWRRLWQPRPPLV